MQMNNIASGILFLVEKHVHWKLKLVTSSAG